MRPLASAVALALAAVSAATADQGLDQARRVAALAQPAIDGVTLAGIRVGGDELTVRGLFGEPASVGASPLADRFLRYEPVPGVVLDVHLVASRVVAVGLRVSGERAAGPWPPTVRGIRLADPITLVKERYGDPDGGRLWFAEAGIAFNDEGAGDEVEAILIFAPGTPPP